MTELNGKKARLYNVGITSVLRRCVAATAVLVVMVALTGGAQAAQSAWSSFAQRCLAPFEDFAAVELDGLSPAPITVSDQIGYGAGDQAQAFTISPRVRLVFDPAPDPSQEMSRVCAVESAAPRHPDNSEDVHAWVQEQIALGRYELIPERSSNRRQVLDTVNWIEPRLWVIISYSSHYEHLSLSVWETYLES